MALLHRHGIEQVADVRSVPGSRRLPHFSGAALSSILDAAGVAYRHVPELGAWRKPRPGSGNDALTLKGFQGYADHMATGAFGAGLVLPAEVARARPTAFMCAGGDWRRCHRRLIADALTVRRLTVRHIGPDGRLEEHRLPPFAVVRGEGITYPSADAQERIDL